jgi:hypothetical protein
MSAGECGWVVSAAECRYPIPTMGLLRTVAPVEP